MPCAAKSPRRMTGLKENIVPAHIHEGAGKPPNLAAASGYNDEHTAVQRIQLAGFPTRYRWECGMKWMYRNKQRSHRPSATCGEPSEKRRGSLACCGSYSCGNHLLLKTNICCCRRCCRLSLSLFLCPSISVRLNNPPLYGFWLNHGVIICII